VLIGDIRRTVIRDIRSIRGIFIRDIRGIVIRDSRLIRSTGIKNITLTRISALLSGLLGLLRLVGFFFVLMLIWSFG
jgi:hypothetical protein